jgi:CheY-like chemotaxis protein/nitrogen-specific signal transduction histidine kinase
VIGERTPWSRSEEAAWATLLQNRRVQEVNRLKSEFLANMSHELRTPLNAIIGFAELMVDGYVEPGSAEQKEFLGDILSSARHLLQLISDVLDLVKVESGRLELHPEPMEPALLVAEVSALLKASLIGKGLELQLETDPSLAVVALDRMRFKQVVYNYLSNAVKFTPTGGRITVRLSPEAGDDGTAGAALRLEVTDTGIGIAPAELDGLFVEFLQLDGGSAKRHPGTGLGLALTRRVVEAQGGTVGVRSTPGQGSTFFARLPIGEYPAGAGAAAGDRPMPDSTEPRDETPRVLVVDSDQGRSALAVETLTDAGYRVDSGATGAAALDLCERYDYDALVLSDCLPDMSTVELLAVVRAAGRNREAATIMLAPPGHDAAMASMVHDVLELPLNAEVLLISLRSAGVRPDDRCGVLVVDDDRAALRLMEAVLARSGYGSVCRSNGKSGLEAARHLEPIAVVVDLTMPGMNGFQFIEHLRALPDHRHTPVFVWSTKDLSPEERRRLSANVQGVIAKTGAGASRLMAELQAALPPASLLGPPPGTDSGKGTFR